MIKLCIALFLNAEMTRYLHVLEVLTVKKSDVWQLSPSVPNRNSASLIWQIWGKVSLIWAWFTAVLVYMILKETQTFRQTKLNPANIASMLQNATQKIENSQHVVICFSYLLLLAYSSAINSIDVFFHIFYSLINL